MDRRELTAQDLKRMRLPKGYWECTYKGISEGNQGFVLTYFKNIDLLMDQGIGLLLWGENGRGKTGIMAVIGKECRRRGYSVLFMEAADMKRIVTKDVPFDEHGSMWERARDVKVLLLDDLGKGVDDNTGFGVKLIDELVRHRAAENLVTFITTNMSTEKMSQILIPSTMHTMKARLHPERVKGSDLREGIKDSISELFKEGA